MLRSMPARWRWWSLAVAALLTVFLLWFVVCRTPPGARPVTVPPPPRPALGKTLPYEQYAAAVDSALSDVRAARSLSGDDRKKKLQSAAATLEKVEGASVTPPGAL